MNMFSVKKRHLLQKMCKVKCKNRTFAAYSFFTHLLFGEKC